jgi:hypothetical protein
VTPVETALAAARVSALQSRLDRPSDVHVVPADDGEPEHVESAGCWCSPDFDGDGALVVWTHYPAGVGQ